MKFSIIIPTLNSHKTLRRCLNSVINQSYKNWEIIIVDSSDNQLCKSISNQFKLKEKLIYIRSNKKKGLAYDRYLGIAAANGDYISFLDSDDIWKKNKLKNQYNLIIKTKSKFLCSNYTLKISNKIFYNNTNKNYFDLKYLFKNRPISNSAATVEAKIIKKVAKKYNKNLMAEDFLWWSIILKNHVNKCHIVKSFDVQNNVTNNSRSKKFIYNYISLYKIYRYWHDLNYFKICYYFMHLSVVTFRKKIFKLIKY